MADNDYGKCAYCDKPAEKYKSGVPICYKCWYDIKLDRPAASHWTKATTHLLSNIDMYDRMTFFKKMGLTEDEWKTMLKVAEKLLKATDKVLFPEAPLDTLEDADKTIRIMTYLGSNK